AGTLSRQLAIIQENSLALEAAGRQARAAADSLSRSEASLRRSQAMAHLGSYEVDLQDPSQNWWSDETWQISGLPQAPTPPTVADFVQQVVHPEDRELVSAGFERAVREGAQYLQDYRIRRPDGQLRWVQSQAEPALGPDGRVLRMTGTLMDITERKLAEVELRGAKDAAENANRRLQESLL